MRPWPGCISSWSSIAGWGCCWGPTAAASRSCWRSSPSSSAAAGRPAAKVNLLAIEPAEMLWLVALELGLNPEPAQSTAALWRMVTDRLLEYRYQQIETAILLDDADQASREVLAQVAPAGAIRSARPRRG